jgi:hypothetical protein
MGLAHMYQYGDTGKVYRDMPLPIDKHNTLRHVGGNAKGIKPYTKNKGMMSMSSNLWGLQAGSVSIIEPNVEWQEYEWRENTYQTLRKTFGDAWVEYKTSKKLKAGITQVEPSQLHLAAGLTSDVAHYAFIYLFGIHHRLIHKSSDRRASKICTS